MTDSEQLERLKNLYREWRNDPVFMSKTPVGFLIQFDKILNEVNEGETYADSGCNQ